VHAVVVARSADLSAGQLIGFAREQLAGFKCPTGVTTVEALPRNVTGKVLRAALREPFWAGRDRRIS
jgi:long-chain acyl-CoA synthetase